MNLVGYLLLIIVYFTVKKHQDNHVYHYQFDIFYKYCNQNLYILQEWSIMQDQEFSCDHNSVTRTSYHHLHLQQSNIINYYLSNI